MRVKGRRARDRTPRGLGLGLGWGVMVCLVAAVGAGAQDGPRGLTLDEAIEIALQKHPGLRAAERAIEISETGYGEADAIKDWQFEATAVGTLSGPQTSIEFPDPITGATRKITLGEPFTTNFGVSITKPLYAGGREKLAWDLTTLDVESSRLQRAQKAQEVIIGVKRAYYGLLKALRLRGVAQEAVDRAQDHLRIAQARVDVGEAAPLDAIQAQVDLANAEHGLVMAESGVALARSALNNAMGVPLDAPTGVQEAQAIKFVGVDRAQANAVARANRPELASLDKAVEAAEKRAELERAVGKPTVALQGGPQYQTGSPFLEGFSWRIGLVVSKPLGSQKAADARAERAERQADQLRDQHEVLVQAIGLQIEQALLHLDQARDAIRVEQANIQRAQEAYRVAQLAYENGVGPRITVKDAQVALTQAQTNLAQAIYDYHLAVSELEFAVGVRDLGPLGVPDVTTPGPVMPPG